MMRKTIKMALAAAVGFSALTAAQPAFAGGILGDIVNVVIPGAGTALDEAHRDFKESGVVPGYREVEEGVSGGVRHVANEAVGEVGGEAIAQQIWASKSDAVNAGVSPIPINIRNQLAGYFPESLLNSVRFRVGIGHELALPANAFRAGAAAITLDDVIVFRAGSDGHFDAKLWAHELTHVQQYQRWGVRDFAKQYAKNHGDVEREAEVNADRWESYRLAQSAAPRPRPVGFSTGGGPFMPPMGNFCYTPAGRFGPGPVNPIGAPCSVVGPWGPMVGQVGR